jgi:hypothetical protein
MAWLYIDEYKDLPTITSWGAIPQAPVTPALATSRVAIGGTSAQSVNFNAKTNFILLHTDSICSIAFSADATVPVAVATSSRMNANETRFYGVRPGASVAVITNT